MIVKEANVSVLVGRDCEGQCGVTDDAIHLTRVTHICNDDTTDVNNNNNKTLLRHHQIWNFCPVHGCVEH